MACVIVSVVTRSERLRRRLVEELERRGAISTPLVREAFLRVPRELFIPEVAEREGLEGIYQDKAFVTKQDGVGAPISSSSQPGIMAPMLECLDLKPGQRVLEIGSGTGYNAALLKSIVGSRGRVTTVDVDGQLAARARKALRAGGYAVRVVVGDGRKGRRAGAPFDRVICTASSPDVPRAWVRQLAPAGLIEVPFRLAPSNFGPQAVVTFRRHQQELESVRVICGGFMTLRAANEGARDYPLLSIVERVNGTRSLLGFQGDVVRRLGRAGRRRLAGLMLREPRRRALGMRVGADTWGLHYYIALGAPAARVVSVGGWRSAIVDREARGVAMLNRDGKRVSVIEAYGDREPERLLLRLVEEWKRLGRPGEEDLHIRVRYGARTRRTAWRASPRGDCTIFFDWATPPASS